MKINNNSIINIVNTANIYFVGMKILCYKSSCFMYLDVKRIVYYYF